MVRSLFKFIRDISNFFCGVSLGEDVNDIKDQVTNFLKGEKEKLDVEMEDYTMEIDPDASHDFMTQVMLGKHGDPEYWKSFMKDSNMNEFKKVAYKSKEGYAIRVNPLTGKKEMMVAGTRSVRDWLQNVLEVSGTVSGRVSDMKRDEYAQKLSKISAENEVYFV